jgi:hypothetical protein
MTAPTTQIAARAQSADALTRELLETLQMMVLHFTKTPSTLADSKARGKAHEVIAKAYEQIGYTAPTAALENGDGRDAWLLKLYEVLMQQNIVTSEESYLSLRCVGVPPTEAEFATVVQRAIDAALSQKAGEQQ